MTHPDTNMKLRIIKREVYSKLQRDEELIETLLEELTKEGSQASITVNSFRQNKNGSLGSELLGELKHAIELEYLVVQRCWSVMGKQWFEECSRNMDF